MKTETKTMKCNCFAKVNLVLDVVKRRADGYHDVKMIMQEIGIKDVLTVTVSEGRGVGISCTDSRIPCDESNLAAKAATLFMRESGFEARIDIHIEKRIPAGAGLGGGSSDAAGVLRTLNEVFNRRFTDAELAAIGARIGADVPFFIYGGAMLAEGIGTELKKIEPLSEGIIVVAKPQFDVMTAHVYQKLVLDKKMKHPDTCEAIKAVANSDLKTLAACGGNVLEKVTAAEHAEIDEYKNIMKDCGAPYALMSGSGPSVFGIFENEGDAEKAVKILESRTSEVFKSRLSSIAADMP